MLLASDVGLEAIGPMINSVPLYPKFTTPVVSKVISVSVVGTDTEETIKGEARNRVRRLCYKLMSPKRYFLLKCLALMAKRS